MPEYPGFVGPSNRSQSIYADCERLVNWYVERQQTALGRPGLYPIPGSSVFAATTGVGGRALYTNNGRTFAVIGGDVIEVFATKTVAKYGSVLNDGALAHITVNGITGNQALFASGSNAYSLNLATNVLSAAVLTGEAHQIGMLDGYGLAFNRTVGKLRLSNLNDFTTWDPTQFALRSAAPDNWQAMLVNAPDVWLIGEQTGDVWYDAGTFPFPLAPRPGVTFKWGIAAVESLAAAGDSVFWLSRNAEGSGLLVRARGYTPQPVGSLAFDAAVAGYKNMSRIDDAEAMVFQRWGHTFYVLRFPAANATWAYDLKTGEMCEVGSWNAPQNRYDAWHPRVACAAFGQNLIATSQSGIAQLDDSVGTEVDGTPIRRLRIPPALLASDGRRVFVDRFELDIETGLAAQGARPVVSMRISYDLSRTWGNEQERSLGMTGKYLNRVVWTRGGSSPKGWVPEIVVSDPTPARIVGAQVLARGARTAGAQAGA